MAPRSSRPWPIALLFGVPPAIGVYLAALRVLGSENNRLAILAAVVTLIGMMGAIMIMAHTGSVERGTRPT